MAKLIVETFDVCLGVDEQDPAPTVFAQGMVAEEDALALRDRFMEMLAAGQLDSALAAGKTFYTRRTPGNQWRTIAAQDRPSIRALLRSTRFSVPIYVKTTDDADANADFTRVGTKLSTEL